MKDPIELNVKLHLIDPSECLEVWEIKPQEGKKRPRYVGRSTCDYRWSTLVDAGCDDFIAESNAGKHVVFVICNDRWEPIALDGNDRVRFPEPYPTLEKACSDAWRPFKEQTLIESDRWIFVKWIKSKAERPLTYIESLNWENYKTPVNRKILATFDYLGSKKAILRITYEHTECAATWNEYYVGAAVPLSEEAFCWFYGYEYSFL